ncbi:hypothetical protein DOTSEDRAFT_48512 [Dothistroma septosporum NZE10]|uniref:Formate/nitrite transporter n=1 Tax=Dothistroma septosporum (strain NZE10 / CBS 128990) TaxID=675120 RepID=N1PBK7_DOTSN|nr:hypothetical protein DOTSEDRAFT_48512 [Dothistroma septosporum NZE10]
MTPSLNGFSPQEISALVTAAGIAKSHLTLGEYITKSFFGGIFISLGGLIDLTTIAGSPDLRSSNPGLATLIGGFLFPLGFVLLTLTNMELCTSNMFVMPFVALQRKVTVWDLVKNWGLTYVVNIAGALFVAGFLGWWSDVLDTDGATAYAVSQAEGRVNVQWSVNFLRGVGCNFLVGLAFFMSLGSVEFVSKVYTIWVPIWAFVVAGYQHSIANYFMVPIGMFYGVNFSVGKFVYQSIIPVTLGNIVGGTLLCAVPFWYLYGRGDAVNVQTGQAAGAHDMQKQLGDSEETVGRREPGANQQNRERYDRSGMVQTA